VTPDTLDRRHTRVCPRDLFNEANLLKCLGRVSLLIEDRKLPLRMSHRSPDSGFLVAQDQSDGSILVANLRFRTADGRAVTLRRPLNARAPWPLLAVLDDRDEIYVFDDDGNPSAEFLAAIDA